MRRLRKGVNIAVTTLAIKNSSGGWENFLQEPVWKFKTKDGTKEFATDKHRFQRIGTDEIDEYPFHRWLAMVKTAFIIIFLNFQTDSK